ncbi:MAG: ABC transporter permease [Acetobacteraceae bacterium]|nr:ABC transporter permease [Acetobacteraceae bacterium]MBV8524918.1 ABC transporter permease [Acetobacteraceae bacterium]MBV8591378.1 ABC transporter permease [Acetobacteraceae bacterium]
MLSAALITLFLLNAIFAPFLVPQDPSDLRSLNLTDSLKPPAWMADGVWGYPLGTDGQGRDILSAVMYGARTSLGFGLAALALASLLGIPIGLIAGYTGGFLDSVLMRVADTQLTFPPILIALLLDGIGRAVLSRSMQQSLQPLWVVLAIGVSLWPQFARLVRASTLVERGKDYILAARLVGVSRSRILALHILPNIGSPILVFAAINLSFAIVAEATLSFLGVGLPPTEPSLGTLIMTGNDFLLSGEWWMSLFPGLALMSLVMAINCLADSFQDRLHISPG